MSARKHTRTWSRPVIECLNPLVYLDSTLTADFDGNHRVDTADFTVLAVNFNGTNKTHAQGDATGDGRVNAQDFNVLATEFGRTEPMPLTENDFSGGSDAGLDPSWSLGHIPNINEEAHFEDGSVITENSAGSLTVGGLVADGFGDGLGLENAHLFVVGNAELNNYVGGTTLDAVSGNVLGTGNGGNPLTITTKTNSGTLNFDNDVIITDLDQGTVTLGPAFASNGSGFLVVTSAAAGTAIKANSGSASGSPAASVNTNCLCDYISNKVGSTAVNFDLQGSTLNAASALTSQLNGVTKTDGTGGTFSGFTKLRASGQNNTLATVNGGVEKSHAVLSTISGTYSQSVAAPTAIKLQGDASYFTGFSASNGVWSATIVDGVAGVSGDVTLENFDLSNVINLDTITISAAASGVKNNRISTATGLGL